MSSLQKTSSETTSRASARAPRHMHWLHWASFFYVSPLHPLITSIIIIGYTYRDPKSRELNSNKYQHRVISTNYSFNLYHIHPDNYVSRCIRASAYYQAWGQPRQSCSDELECSLPHTMEPAGNTIGAGHVYACRRWPNDHGCRRRCSCYLYRKWSS